MSIATLGFRTRTEAALHLKALGLGPTEIGKRLGISAGAAGGLTSSVTRQRQSRAKAPRTLGIDAQLAVGTRQKLRPYAAKRGISLEALVLRIVETVADERLADAILDDQEEMHAQSHEMPNPAGETIRSTTGERMRAAPTTGKSPRGAALPSKPTGKAGVK